MILLIESGSTKTEWRYITAANEAFETFFSDGINPYFQTIDEILAAQQATLQTLTAKKIKQVHYYGTGITGVDQQEIIQAVLRPYVGQATIHVANDLEAAAISLCGHTDGIACILGTGSNAGYFEAGKLIEQIPPLGFWLGDEGSGGHLGKKLILHYLHDELPAEVRTAFIKRFGALTRLDVLDKAYKSEMPNRWFAKFSKFIFDYRRNPFIYQLIESSFRSYCELYLLKYSKVHEVPIHFTGSVAFYYADILKRVIGSYKLRVGYISEAPMAGLTLFHKESIR